MARLHALTTLGMMLVLTEPAAAQPAQPDAAPADPVPTPAVEPAPTPDPVVAVVAPEPTTPPKKDKKKKSGRVRVSGYLQVYYKHRVDVNGDDAREPDLFRIGRARVKIDAKVIKNVSVNVEIDPRSPTIAGVLRDGYIQIKNLIPHHRIRLGQQKTQFGYENDVSSSSMYTVTRTEVSESLARGVTLRDIGVGIIGGWPITSQLALEDAITVVNGAGMNVQADDTNRKNVWGRIGLKLEHPAVGTARLGVSGAIGDQLEPADPLAMPPTPAVLFKFKRLGADLQVDHRWVFVAAEYAMGWDTIEGEETSETMGWYVLAAGKTPWHAGPVLRYDTLEEFKRITAGAYWGEPSAKLRALVTYERFEDDAGLHDHRLFLWSQARF